MVVRPSKKVKGLQTGIMQATREEKNDHPDDRGGHVPDRAADERLHIDRILSRAVV